MASVTKLCADGATVIGAAIAAINAALCIKRFITVSFVGHLPVANAARRRAFLVLDEAASVQ